MHPGVGTCALHANELTGGAGIAGEQGEGTLRIDGKTVGYYGLSSASIGLTLGTAKRSEVIVFTTQGSPHQFTASKGKSTADAGVAMIHSGGGANYDTDTLASLAKFSALLSVLARP